MNFNNDLSVGEMSCIKHSVPCLGEDMFETSRGDISICVRYAISVGIGAFLFLNSPWRDLIVSLFNKTENCLKLIFG